MPRCRYHSLDRKLPAQHGPPTCASQAHCLCAECLEDAGPAQLCDAPGEMPVDTVGSEGVGGGHRANTLVGQQRLGGVPELVRELLRERTRDLKGVRAHEDRLRTLVGAPLSLVRGDHWYDSLVFLGPTSLWNTRGAASPPAVDRLAMFRPVSGGVAAPADHRGTKR